MAHEYIHYLEYEPCRLYNRESNKDERVSEALADFFGVLFSIECNDKYRVIVAGNRYLEWEELEGSGWPYAFALHFYTAKGVHHDFSPDFIDYQAWSSVWKLVEVFNATKNSADAYDKLIKL